MRQKSSGTSLRPPQNMKEKEISWTDYGQAPESTGHAKLRSQYDLFIGGEWIAPTSGDYFETINPATGKVLAKIAKAGAEDLECTVDAARSAFSKWNQMPGTERARLLFSVARILQERSREFAIIETMDNGKPIRETRDIDIPLAARHFFYHAGWADKLQEAFPGLDVKPVGVVGQIIPWNFPLLMAAWKLAPALAAGNTVILKPAETTPISALHLVEIFREVGFPPGVVNVLTGFGDIGAMIVNHTGIDKIAFTGSTEVGKMIRQKTAGSGKKISLELGGKSPTIVFGDAPLYEAIEGIVDSIFFNQGQVCCAGSRLLIQEDIAPRFIEMLKDRMKKIRIGDPLDKNMDMGAINSKVQLEKIQQYVRLGEKEGAEKYQPDCACPTEGYFFPPTLFTEVQPSHTIAQEEIFGPVLAVMTFRTKAEAIELANNTPYGLAASVWTKDVSKMIEVSRALKAGTVWGNGTNKFDAAAEFGGYKESGFGREGGHQGLWEYVKTVSKKSETQSHSIKEDQIKHVLPSYSVWKTPKMFIGGKQVRSESGRYFKATASDGKTLLANVPMGSRKDIRNAVEAAAKAGHSWNKATPYLRGQILYRITEMLQSRSNEFTQAIVSQTGKSTQDAQKEIEVCLSRLLYYAGWSDKYTGTVNPVTQTDFNITYPDPVGVVGIVAPQDPPLLGLISKLAPALAAGNTVILIPSESYPLCATLLIEVLETSDIPPGVINIVTGRHEELAPVLAEHRGVHGMDFSGSPEMGKRIEELSVSNLKRTYVDSDTDWFSAQGRDHIRRYLEFKTVWITATS